MKKIIKTEAEWKEILSDEQYKVLREGATERPGAGHFYHFYEPGTYFCAACENQLFDSEHKYDSGSGWPSFYKFANDESLKEYHDNSRGMERTEIRCAACDSHIGHVFDDGPHPTGLRYCVNSIALSFKSK